MTDTIPTTQPDDGEEMRHPPGEAPAYPTTIGKDSEGNLWQAHGFRQQEIAAIRLKVPNSGTDWLDDMIRESLLDEFAGQVLAGIRANSDMYQDVISEDMRKLAWEDADAMLAEKQRREEGGKPNATT